MALQPTRKTPFPRRKTNSNKPGGNNPTGKGGFGTAEWNPSLYAHTRDLVELRGRTLAQSPDDPLAESGWWATIEKGVPRDGNVRYVRLHRLRNVTKLPSGVWSFRTVRGDTNDTVDFAFRFEGMQPGWVHASAEAKEDWGKVTWVQAEAEPGLPVPVLKDYRKVDAVKPRVYTN